MKHLLKIIFFLVSSITIALAFSVNGLGAEYVQTADKLIYLPLLMREYPLKTMPIAFMGWPTRQTVDIYTVNDNGGQLRNLTNNPSKIHTLNWSPDGAKIVFNSLMNGYYDIYTVNADGGDLKQLTNDLDPDSGPSWSPDGGRIAFISYRGSSWDIFSMNPDGSEVTLLADLPNNCWEPLWSPDGSKIAFYASGPTANDAEIYVMNRDGSSLTKLTDNVYRDRLLAWWSDGSKLLFISNRNTGGSSSNFDLFSVNIDGTGLNQFTSSYYVQYASISPDGSKIAYDGGYQGNWGVFIMDADGSNIAPLTCQSASIGSATMTWSPDGSKIAYDLGSFIMGETSGIYVVNVDGSNCLHLTTMLASTPRWRPDKK